MGIFWGVLASILLCVVKVRMKLGDLRLFLGDLTDFNIKVGYLFILIKNNRNFGP
jgi:hypothetical protein